MLREYQCNTACFWLGEVRDNTKVASGPSPLSWGNFSPDGSGVDFGDYSWFYNRTKKVLTSSKPLQSKGYDGAQKLKTTKDISPGGGF